MYRVLPPRSVKTPDQIYLNCCSFCITVRRITLWEMRNPSLSACMSSQTLYWIVSPWLIDRGVRVWFLPPREHVQLCFLRLPAMDGCSNICIWILEQALFCCVTRERSNNEYVDMSKIVQETNSGCHYWVVTSGFTLKNLDYIIVQFLHIIYKMLEKMTDVELKIWEDVCEDLCCEMVETGGAD